MSNQKDIIFIETKDGLLELDIVAISGWEDFDKLIIFLEQYYSAEQVKKFDGIGSRYCQLKIGNNLIQLNHDDFCGNSLKSLSKQGYTVIKKIGEDLEKRFKTTE